MSKEAELLYEAFHSEYGIEVEILGNYQVSLQRLYTAKRKDPDLDILQISRSPTSPTHIWIVKTDRPLAEPPAHAAKRLRYAKQLKENSQGEGELFRLSDILGDD